MPLSGLPAQNLRHMGIENLPAIETYDCLTSLYKFRYYPSLNLPLGIMARATRKVLIIRGTFGLEREERFLPDVLLEENFQALHASFNIYSKKEVEDILRFEGFQIKWVPDLRQQEVFSGAAEVVGGISFNYEFLVAERVLPSPNESVRLGEYWGNCARLFTSHGVGLPTSK